LQLLDLNILTLPDDEFPQLFNHFLSL